MKLQNRRFLRPATFVLPKALPTPTNLLPASPSETTPPTVPHPTTPMQAQPQPTQTTVTRSSNMLRRLVSHNAPGLLEQQPLAPRR